MDHCLDQMFLLQETQPEYHPYKRLTRMLGGDWEPLARIHRPAVPVEADLVHSAEFVLGPAEKQPDYRQEFRKVWARAVEQSGLSMYLKKLQDA